MSSTSTKTIVKIYFNNGCTSLLYDDTTHVGDLIRQVIKGRLCQNNDLLRYKKCYQLRATKFSNSTTTDSILSFKWLKHDCYFKQFLQTIENDEPDCWRFMLRVRCLPTDLNEVHFKDRVTFVYYYEQIKNDFMQYEVNRVANLTDDVSVDESKYQLILELGCLEMRRALQNMKTTGGSDNKKINFDYLEKDVGLKRFLPDYVLQYKPKNLKKLISKCMKDYDSLSEDDCMLAFLNKLKILWKYNCEIYENCHLGTTWSVPIKISLNYENGISCFMKDLNDPFQVINYEKIVRINVTKDQTGNFYLLQLNLKQTEEPLFIKVSSMDTAADLALLIDAYFMLKTNTDQYLWTDSMANGNATNLFEPSKKNSLSSNNQLLPDDDGGEDEYSFIDQCYEISRDSLDFVEKLGFGQFGDVFKGTYTPRQGQDRTRQVVAIKMLKINEDNNDDEKSAITAKFIQEAKIMQSFEHPHIIKLIGVCTEYPSLIVMELAQNGQLRKYLQLNMNRIDIATLILYCYQLNTAMSYLESKKFVHRDIAARNVLVFNPDCVKLADFGLSREVEENFYLASKSKLPIKWLAPESINFRKFTSSSDVWMLGVCFWEILSFGEKPFQGIKNTDVIHLIEQKQRLEKPVNCPDELYVIMTKCWEYDPFVRPKFDQLSEILNSIYMTYKQQKPTASPFTTLEKTSSLDFKKFNFTPNKHDTSVDEINLSQTHPPPKPRRISSTNSKFQYPNITSDLIQQNTQASSSTSNNNSFNNSSQKLLQRQTSNTDSVWLDDRLKCLSLNDSRLTLSPAVSSLSSVTTATTASSSNAAAAAATTTPQQQLTNKNVQLRDHTYAFIQRISSFVHSLSKQDATISQLKCENSELKLIVYSWNELCSTYESYPVILSKSKTINELVDDLDANLTRMIEELKVNNLEKVIGIALDLARKANNLFCTIAQAT